MVLSASVSGVDTTSSRRVECESRPGISSNRRFQRLETQSGSVLGSSQKIGPFPGRPICIPADKSITQICLLEARSTSYVHGCILNGMGKNLGLCLSPVCPNRSLFTTTTGTEGGPSSSGGTGMANSAMVPFATADVCRSACTHCTIPSTPEQGRTIASSNQYSISWVEAVSKEHQNQNFQRKLQRFY